MANSANAGTSHAAIVDAGGNKTLFTAVAANAPIKPPHNPNIQPVTMTGRNDNAPTLAPALSMTG